MSVLNTSFSSRRSSTTSDESSRPATVESSAATSRKASLTSLAGFTVAPPPRTASRFGVVAKASSSAAQQQQLQRQQQQQQLQRGQQQEQQHLQQLRRGTLAPGAAEKPQQATTRPSTGQRSGSGGANNAGSTEYKFGDSASNHYLTPSSFAQLDEALARRGGGGGVGGAGSSRRASALSFTGLSPPSKPLSLSQQQLQRTSPHSAPLLPSALLTPPGSRFGPLPFSLVSPTVFPLFGAGSGPVALIRADGLPSMTALFQSIVASPLLLREAEDEERRQQHRSAAARRASLAAAANGLNNNSLVVVPRKPQRTAGVMTSRRKELEERKRRAAAHRERTRFLISVWTHATYLLFVVYHIMRPVRKLRQRKAIMRWKNHNAFVIQCAWRRVLQRQRLHRYWAVRTISKRFSRVLRYAAEKKRKAATAVQSVIRGFLARRVYKRIRWDAYVAMLRRCVQRKLLRIRRRRACRFRRDLIEERWLLLDSFVRHLHQLARDEFRDFFHLTTTHPAGVHQTMQRLRSERQVASDRIMNKTYGYKPLGDESSESSSPGASPRSESMSGIIVGGVGSATSVLSDEQQRQNSAEAVWPYTAHLPLKQQQQLQQATSQVVGGARIVASNNNTPPISGSEKGQFTPPALLALAQQHPGGTGSPLVGQGRQQQPQQPSSAQSSPRDAEDSVKQQLRSGSNSQVTTPKKNQDVDLRKVQRDDDDDDDKDDDKEQQSDPEEDDDRFYDSLRATAADVSIITYVAVERQLALPANNNNNNNINRFESSTRRGSTTSTLASPSGRDSSRAVRAQQQQDQQQDQQPAAAAVELEGTNSSISNGRDSSGEFGGDAAAHAHSIDGYMTMMNPPLDSTLAGSREDDDIDERPEEAMRAQRGEVEGQHVEEDDDDDDEQRQLLRATARQLIVETDKHGKDATSSLTIEIPNDSLAGAGISGATNSGNSGSNSPRGIGAGLTHTSSGLLLGASISSAGSSNNNNNNNMSASTSTNVDPQQQEFLQQSQRQLLGRRSDLATTTTTTTNTSSQSRESSSSSGTSQQQKKPEEQQQQQQQSPQNLSLQQSARSSPQAQVHSTPPSASHQHHHRQHHAALVTLVTFAAQPLAGSFGNNTSPIGSAGSSQSSAVAITPHSTPGCSTANRSSGHLADERSHVFGSAQSIEMTPPGPNGDGQYFKHRHHQHERIHQSAAASPAARAVSSASGTTATSVSASAAATAGSSPSSASVADVTAPSAKNSINNNNNSSNNKQMRVAPSFGSSGKISPSVSGSVVTASIASNIKATTVVLPDDEEESDPLPHTPSQRRNTAAPLNTLAASSSSSSGRGGVAITAPLVSPAENRRHSVAVQHQLLLRQHQVEMQRRRDRQYKSEQDDEARLNKGAVQVSVNSFMAQMMQTINWTLHRDDGLPLPSFEMQSSSSLVWEHTLTGILTPNSLKQQQQQQNSNNNNAGAAANSVMTGATLGRMVESGINSDDLTSHHQQQQQQQHADLGALAHSTSHVYRRMSVVAANEDHARSKFFSANLVKRATSADDNIAGNSSSNNNADYASTALLLRQGSMSPRTTALLLAQQRLPSHEPRKITPGSASSDSTPTPPLTAASSSFGVSAAAAASPSAVSSKAATSGGVSAMSLLGARGAGNNLSGNNFSRSQRGDANVDIDTLIQILEHTEETNKQLRLQTQVAAAAAAAVGAALSRRPSVAALASNAISRRASIASLPGLSHSITSDHGLHGGSLFLTGGGPAHTIYFTADAASGGLLVQHTHALRMPNGEWINLSDYPPLKEPVLRAYGDLIEIAEQLSRKAIQQQQHYSAHEVSERQQCARLLVDVKKKIPAYFHSIVSGISPAWALRRAMQLILDELTEREKIIALFMHVPLRPPWQQRAFGGTFKATFSVAHCSAEPPIVTVPRAERDTGFVADHGRGSALQPLAGLVVRSVEGVALRIGNQTPPSSDDEDEYDDDDDEEYSSSDYDEEDEFEEALQFDAEGNPNRPSHHHHQHHHHSRRKRRHHQHHRANQRDRDQQRASNYGMSNNNNNTNNSKSKAFSVSASASKRPGGKSGSDFRKVATLEELEDMEHEMKTKSRKESRWSSNMKRDFGVIALEDAEERRTRMLKTGLAEATASSTAQQPGRKDRGGGGGGGARPARRKHRASYFASLTEQSVSESDMRDLKEGLLGLQATTAAGAATSASSPASSLLLTPAPPSASASNSQQQQPQQAPTYRRKIQRETVLAGLAASPTVSALKQPSSRSSDGFNKNSRGGARGDSQDASGGTALDGAEQQHHQGGDTASEQAAKKKKKEVKFV